MIRVKRSKVTNVHLPGPLGSKWVGAGHHQPESTGFFAKVKDFFDGLGSSP